MTLPKTMPSAAIVALILASTLPSGVWAQTSADTAAVAAGKAQGLVGEQADGYLGVLRGADAATSASVAHINEARARVYAEIAAKTGVTVAQAGDAAAIQLIARLPAGAYYKPAGGDWTRK